MLRDDVIQVTVVVCPSREAVSVYTVLLLSQMSRVVYCLLLGRHTQPQDSPECQWQRPGADQTPLLLEQPCVQVGTALRYPSFPRDVSGSHSLEYDLIISICTVFKYLYFFGYCISKTNTVLLTPLHF